MINSALAKHQAMLRVSEYYFIINNRKLHQHTTDLKASPLKEAMKGKIYSYVDCPWGEERCLVHVYKPTVTSILRLQIEMLCQYSPKSQRKTNIPPPSTYRPSRWAAPPSVMVFTNIPSFSKPWSAPTPIPMMLIPRPLSPGQRRVTCNQKIPRHREDSLDKLLLTIQRTHL